MPPTFTYSLQGSAPNQYLRLSAVGGTFEPNYDLVLNTDVFSGQTYPVKEIASNNVFSNNTSAIANLRSIVMNNLTTIIGNSIFLNCIGLQSVSFSSLTTLSGTAIFSGCTSLTDFTRINLGTTITTLPNNTFSNCRFVDVVLPSHITTLGDGVFGLNTALQSFSAPQLIGIGTAIFTGCTSLTDFTRINLGTTITTLPNNIFYDCRFVNIVLPSHITTLNNSVFTNNTALQSFSAPQLTSIGSSTFSYNTALQNFSAPQLTSIGSSTFSQCTSLTTCVVGTINSLSDFLFYYCTNLLNVYIRLSNPPTTIGSYVFQGAYNLQYIFVPLTSTWAGQTIEGKTVTAVQLPIASTPSYTTTTNAVQLHTSGSTPLIPMGYTVPYYTYKWYKNGIQQSGTSSQLAIQNSISDTYSVKAVDPLNQESAQSTEITNQTVISGVNYVKIN